ncbi:MAG: hypothetical protein CMG44_03145 [Candidatus Marinimicrobia bacterium]|nr:hypothetical protein [Candidatus Neomarinimicrobiota bacterium]
MITDSSKTKSILIKYKTDKPVRKTPYQVKGVIMKQFSKEEIVPMLNGQYRKKFLYPRIQVKVFNEEIFLIGLNQGVDPILKLQGRIKELNFGDITFQIQESEIQEEAELFHLTSTLYKYRFVSNWVALNHSTKNKYHSSNDNDRLQFLNKLLGENIVFIAREMGFEFEKNIFSKIKISSLTPSILDHKGWGAFDGEFYTNLILPNYIGIGNGITSGHGAILGEFSDENFDFHSEEFEALIKDAEISKAITDENNLTSSLTELEVEKVPKPIISKHRKKKKKRFKSKNPKSKTFSENRLNSNHNNKNKKTINPKSKMKKDNQGSINYNSEEYHKKQHTIK